MQFSSLSSSYFGHLINVLQQTNNHHRNNRCRQSQKKKLAMGKRNFEAEQMQNNKYTEAILELPEGLQGEIVGYFFLPPRPINGGWGRQPHIDAYFRKHKMPQKTKFTWGTPRPGK
jgi:hypothetical protein